MGLSFLQERNVRDEGLQKGQWLTPSYQLLSEMGLDPESLDRYGSTLLSPFCSLAVKSMLSDYFPLNASFTFTLQKALLKHPLSFTQSLSMVAL